MAFCSILFSEYWRVLWDPVSDPFFLLGSCLYSSRMTLLLTPVCVRAYKEFRNQWPQQKATSTYIITYIQHFFFCGLHNHQTLLHGAGGMKSLQPCYPSVLYNLLLLDGHIFIYILKINFMRLSHQHLCFLLTSGDPVREKLECTMSSGWEKPFWWL